MDITNQKKNIAIAVAVAFFLVVTTASLTSLIQSWRWDQKLSNQAANYEKQLSEINRVSNEKLVEQTLRREKSEAALAALEKKQYEELVNAQQENDRLVNDLATARRRLSIATTNYSTSRSRASETSSTSSMDHETTQAYINPRDAANIFSVTRRGDEAIRQLNACQDYILEQTK